MKSLDIGRSLNAPEPAQDIDGENGDARSGGNSGECFLGTGFAVRETIAADHDGDQTGNLGNRSGEEALDGGKAGVEGEFCASAATGMTRNRMKVIAVKRAHFDRRRAGFGE